MARGSEDRARRRRELDGGARADEGRRSSPDDEGDEELSGRDSALLLLRDIAVAVVLVLIVLGAVFGYTQVWPPMVVIESDSMSHDGGASLHNGAAPSYPGVVDTGDLVLVQVAPSKADVVTWVEGKPTGYRTYGDFGDVLIFHPTPYALDSTPIIHRPIVYLVWNETSFATWDRPAWDIPSLRALEARLWTTTTGAWYNLSGDLTLRELGYRGDLAKTISLAALAANVANRVDGYLTMGDNNAYRGGFDSWGIVPHSRVVGKARGELPWFGLIKLLVSPGGSCCRSWGDVRPLGAAKNSWDSLALTLVLLPVGVYLADYAYGFAEDSWTWWRRSKKAARDARKARKDASGPEEPEPDPGDDLR